MYNQGIIAACVIVVIAAFPATGLAASRDSTFGVESYIPERFTDFQWRLDGGINMQGYRMEGNQQTHTLDQQRLTLLSNLDYFHETRDRQYALSLNTAFDMDNINPGSSSNSGNLFEFTSDVYPQVSIRQYLVSNLHVTVVGQAWWMYSHRLHDLNPDRYAREYSVDGTVAPGWGRLYDGRFASTALYIIDELKARGLIDRPPTVEEMRLLTALVYSSRLTRPTDKRLHKIESLQSIMQFLEQRGIAAAAGPYGYLLIQDVWDYYPNEARRFGGRIGIGLGLVYRHLTEETTTEYTASSGSYHHQYSHQIVKVHKPYIEPVIEYHKPLSLRWQADLAAAWRYYLNSFGRNNYLLIDYSPYQSLQRLESSDEGWAEHILTISGGLTYLIDSRTTARISPSYRVDRGHSVRVRFRPPGENVAYIHGVLELTTRLEYRIATPTTFRVDLVLLRSDTKETYGASYFYRAHTDEYDESKYFISTSITHYLF